MKILQRYVFTSFLSSFFLAFLVLTFVLSVGLLVKATQLVVDDMPISVVARFLAVGIPESFSFTIPLASLVSSLLVFGRLSSDGEIGAMKACGVNLWGIMFPLILFGLAMSAFGVYINNCVTPQSHLMRRSLQTDIKSNGLLLLEPGTEQEVFGKTIWFESKDEDGTLVNVHIREAFTKVVTNATTKTVSTNSVPRTIQAARALTAQSGDDLQLDLYNVRVDPFSENFPGAATAEHLTHVIPDVMKTKTYNAKIEDLSLPALLEEVKKNLPEKVALMAASSVETRAELAGMLARLSETEGYETGELMRAVNGRHPDTMRQASADVNEGIKAEEADVKAVEEELARVFSVAGTNAVATTFFPDAAASDAAGTAISTEAEGIQSPTNSLAIALSTDPRIVAGKARIERLSSLRNRFEHLARILENLARYRKELRKHTFELHRRFAMASATFCFLMLGMPLGIRARRRESTIGIAISLGIALLYYLLVVAGEQFTKNVGGPVHLIVWIPAVVCLAVSAWLTTRNS